MNSKRQVEFTNSIKSLHLHTLELLRDYLKEKQSEDDREDKIRLIEIEIEGKKKQKDRLKNYENQAK